MDAEHRERLRRLRDAVVFSNLWVAVGAAAMGEVTLLVSGHPHGHRVPAFLFLVTAFTYNYHRLFRGRGAEVPTHTERHRWIARRRRGLAMLTLLAGLGAAALALRFSPRSLALVAPFGVVALFYSVVPFSLRGPGIRDLPVVKVFLVALTWAATTAVLPMMESVAPAPSLGRLLAEGAARFFFILALTIPFDVRDLPHDAPSKRTLPQLVGVRGAKLLSLAALAAFVSLAWARPDLDPPVTLALAGSAGLTAFLVAGVHRNRSEVYYTGWIESMMLVQYLLVLAAS